MATMEIKKRVKNGVLYTNGMIRIDAVRGSYVHADKPYAGKTDDGKEAQPKYSIVGMLPKETHEEIKKLCEEVIASVLADNKNAKVAKDKRFIRDGDDSDKDEYAGFWTVSAREEKKPKCRTRTGELVTEPSEIKEMFVSGYWFNILIRPWFQDNSYGKRVNAGIVGIQFVKKDTPFGEGNIDETDAWDTVEGDDDDMGDDGL